MKGFQYIDTAGSVLEGPPVTCEHSKHRKTEWGEELPSRAQADWNKIQKGTWSG